MFIEELKKVPKQSGCYLMYNSFNTVIYVGKAKNLQNRLRSYFRSNNSLKVNRLVSEISYFDYIVTNNEKEALILELNLIKKYEPKYNVLLKDDKSYPYIVLTNEKHPILTIKRKLNINKSSSNVFGPFPNAYAAKRLVGLINRLYPLRKCKVLGKKKCLYFHIGECLGYCENNQIDNKEMIEEVLSILKGNDKLLKEKLNEKIKLNSKNMNYELCKELLEDYNYIDNIFLSQNVELNKNIDIDVINFYEKDNYISTIVMFIRNGKIIGVDNKIISVIGDIKGALEYYIYSLYYKKNILPEEVIIPSVVDKSLLESVIDSKFIYTKKGSKHKLFKMAYDNAKIYYKNNINKTIQEENITIKANEELRKLLGLKSLIRIEAFDNSSLFGSYSVSAMVVFINGKEARKEYRKYKLNINKNDDIASLKEVIYRRYFKVLNENLIIPDLIIVDGGFNQVKACIEVLSSLNLNIKVIGVKKDKSHKPNKIIDEYNNELDIEKGSNIFLYLSKIDNEVHRFTVSFHRNLRSKGNVESILDNIKGIGRVRKKKLLDKYTTIENIKNETEENLSKILPKETAKALLSRLNNR